MKRRGHRGGMMVITTDQGSQPRWQSSLLIRVMTELTAIITTQGSWPRWDMTLGKRHKRKERERARGRRRGRRLSQSSAIDIGIAIDKKLIKASGRSRTKKKKLQIFSIKGRIVELRAVILTTSSPLHCRATGGQSFTLFRRHFLAIQIFLGTAESK